MTKRKADSDIECDTLVKSLRRSITDFLAKNDAVNGEMENGGKSGSTAIIDPGLDGEKAWELYGRRLATFDVASRLAKPKELSPVVCARHGWKNDGGEFLRCDDCGKVLYIKLPGDEASIRVVNHCVRHIQRKLVEAHTVICPWRISPGLNTSATYDIPSRYQMLADSGQPELPFTDNVLDEDLVDKFGVQSRFFLLMAIFGWLPVPKSDETKKPNYYCSLCGRHLWASVFSTVENPLNPREQHHSYCPVVEDRDFPLWRESMQNVQKLKKKEALFPSMRSVKSMLKRMFSGGGTDNGEKQNGRGGKSPEGGGENGMAGISAKEGEKEKGERGREETEVEENEGGSERENGQTEEGERENGQ